MALDGAHFGMSACINRYTGLKKRLDFTRLARKLASGNLDASDSDTDHDAEHATDAGPEISMSSLADALDIPAAKPTATRSSIAGGAAPQPSIESQTATSRRRKKSTDTLMWAQTIQELPLDFEDNYLSVLCPFGTRCLLVASNGTCTGL